MLKTNEYNGVLSLLGVCNDFNNDYCESRMINLTVQQQKDTGVVLGSFSHKTKNCIPAKTSIASFLVLKSMVDKETHLSYGDNQGLHKIVNSIFSFFENEPILGFCDQYIKEQDLLFANIVFKRGNDYLCSEIGLGDLLCLSIELNMPVFIKKEIIDKYGVDFEKTTKI